jgi:outer membrane beta-barrel protein
MRRQLATYILVLLASVPVRALCDDTTVIEKQLEEIGTIQNEEIVVVQRKYTKKNWRHEFTPVIFGGVPFGTVRRTLLGGASYTLHANDNWGFELLNFSYTKTFFSSFTDDINNNKEGTQAKIKPDFQKLLYFLTMGVQWTPMYGKAATFSRWIAYIEPFFGFGAGLARTEAASYFTVYPAFGIRAFFREWFSMKFEFRDYLYTEKFLTRTNPPTQASALRNNYAVTLSLSFWLPKMP